MAFELFRQNLAKLLSPMNALLIIASFASVILIFASGIDRYGTVPTTERIFALYGLVYLVGFFWALIFSGQLFLASDDADHLARHYARLYDIRYGLVIAKVCSFLSATVIVAVISYSLSFVSLRLLIDWPEISTFAPTNIIASSVLAWSCGSLLLAALAQVFSHAFSIALTAAAIAGGHVANWLGGVVLESNNEAASSIVTIFTKLWNFSPYLPNSYESLTAPLFATSTLTALGFSLLFCGFIMLQEQRRQEYFGRKAP